MFSRIRSRRTTRPSTRPADLHEHVVEQDRRVGQDHPLGRAVADVALVPQRLVLERRSGRSRGAGGRGPAIRSDRIGLRLWGIALRALLAGLERLLTSPISVCWRLRISVAKRSREPPRIAIAVEERRVAVALDDLGARPGRRAARARARTSASTSGPRWLYVPTGPEILPVAISSIAAARRAPAAVDLERPAGELEPERDRLGVDASGSGPSSACPASLAGAGDERGEERGRSRASRSSPAARQLERERRVDDVAARQPEVEVAALGRRPSRRPG